MMVSRSGGLVAELGEKCFVQRCWDVQSQDERFLGGWSRNRRESAINGWDVSRRDDISGNAWVVILLFQVLDNGVGARSRDDGMFSSQG